MYFDPLYIALIAPGLLFMILAQWKVKSTYAKYSRVPNQRRVAGGQLARILLDANRLYDISVERIPGRLTDHYDPRDRVLRLSDAVYGNATVASLGIVAHEVGHVVQDASKYVPMRVRSGLVPVVNVGSTLGYIFLFGGIILRMGGLAWLGVAFFAAGVLFALVTLPVEINASQRAMQLLHASGLVDVSEFRGARSVLNAAAVTYVASLLMGLLNLLYWVVVAAGSERRD
ncbi:MAG: zinc metallopeptidase [Chloroflexi bacterium]|nr:zinc metallopeptidase [Chloroflexota bacterium]